jgi:hypothetical protein
MTVLYIHWLGLVHYGEVGTCCGSRRKPLSNALVGRLRDLLYSNRTFGIVIKNFSFMLHAAGHSPPMPQAHKSPSPSAPLLSSTATTTIPVTFLPDHLATTPAGLGRRVTEHWHRYRLKTQRHVILRPRAIYSYGRSDPRQLDTAQNAVTT